MVVEIGTVSHGTMRSEDLIPEFTYILGRENPEALDALRSDYPEIFAEMDAEWEEGDSEDFSDPEMASRLVDALFDALNEIAPPFCYFGATEGDGADYGFWPSLHSLEEDARYKDGVIKVNDGDEWPMFDDSIHFVMSVSDHGNVTLYDSRTRKEIWAVV